MKKLALAALLLLASRHLEPSSSAGSLCRLGSGWRRELLKMLERGANQQAGLSSKGETRSSPRSTTTAYVSLHTADPVDTGANEVSSGPTRVRGRSPSPAASNPMPSPPIARS